MPSLIRVSRQTTYEDVNSSLSKDPILSEMHRIAGLLREKRLSAGALELSLPELVVRFGPDGNLNLELIPQNSPSRFIVSELMILYNSMAARFCRDNSIPILYRNQPPPNEVVSRGEADFIFYAFQQRRKLNPIQISLSAGAHSGLGVDAYIHATSPIRRYLDLVVQRQIIPFCSGGSPTYGEKDLEEIRIGVDPVIKQMERIKRNRLRYWVTKYLAQKKEMPLKAIVLDELKNKYRIILKDFLLISEMKRENGMLLKPGDEIGVKVKKADPWEDILEIVFRGERGGVSPHGYSN
jgi:exoribonuclease-2